LQEVTAQEALRNQRLRVLIVDDELAVRETLAEFLAQGRGHRTESCEKAEPALDLAAEEPFDCAFIDLQLPDMPGLDLMGRLKEISPAMPVVVITGHPSLEAAVGAMRQGASDFLIKPFSLERVEASLERVMRERRLLLENITLAERLRQKQAVEKLNHELERKMQEQSFCYAISDRLGSVNQIERLYQQVVDLAHELTGAAKIGFMVLDPDTGDLVLVAARGAAEGQLGQKVGEVGIGLAGKSLLSGKPLNEINGRVKGWPYGKGPAIAMPLQIKEEAFGVIVCAGRHEAFNRVEMRLLGFLAEKAALCLENLALYESVMQNLHSTLRALVGTIEAKDAYTEQHSKRVTALSVAIAEEMGVSEEEIEALKFAGCLHDIGKIGIRDHILLKPDKLDIDEYSMVKAHPVIGQNIVRHLGLLPLEQSIIRHHHEAWDGSGYPDGLKGQEIPLLSRILAVADAYDAMTSTRPYRRAKTRLEALDELRRCAGSQFDPDIVEACLRVLEKEILAGPHTELHSAECELAQLS
jgi:putative nucleotidyltransferase with HDIG domain